MSTMLKVTLKLQLIRGDEYLAIVTTEATDSCYKAHSIRRGLPPGKSGLPTVAFVTAELVHEDGPCTENLHYIVQKIDGVHSGGHQQGVTAFATVDDEVVGSDHQPFP